MVRAPQQVDGSFVAQVLERPVHGSQLWHRKKRVHLDREIESAGSVDDRYRRVNDFEELRESEQAGERMVLRPIDDIGIVVDDAIIVVAETQLHKVR